MGKIQITRNKAESHDFDTE